MIRLTATTAGLLLEKDTRLVRAAPDFTLDRLFSAATPGAFAAQAFAAGTPMDAPVRPVLRAPIESQEVWAAGVTYLRSKSARMAEAKDAGGGSFYDRV